MMVEKMATPGNKSVDLFGDGETFEHLVAETLDGLRDLLIAKNRKYGNSALEPLRCFSKASPVEQILVRLDDKLSRIRTSGLSGPDEDTVLDLMGYLVLLRVAQRKARGRS